MILALSIAALVMLIIVTLVTCFQVLYLESLRIRSRELPALEFFKETMQPKLGLSIEHRSVAPPACLGCPAFVLDRRIHVFDVRTRWRPKG
jgi:hypothetical protein